MRRNSLRRERHAGLGSRLLLGRLQAGRPHPDLRQRIFLELHLLPAGREEDRRGAGRGARRQSRPDRPQRPGARHRQAYQTDLDLAHPDPGRPSAAGRGRGQDRQGGGRDVPARRLPVGRPAAGRREQTGLRLPVGHGPQIPARAARHGLPLCAPGDHGGDRADLPRQPRGQVDRRQRIHRLHQRAALRELGALFRRCAGAEDRRRPGQRTGHGCRLEAAEVSGPTACGRASRASRASPSPTSAKSRARSSPSRWPARITSR